MSLDSIARTWRERLSPERRFGAVFCAVFALIATQPVLGGQPARAWAYAVSAVMLAVTLLAPGLLAPLNRGWLALGERLHRIVSPIVLGIVFFGVVTPIALLRSLLGKDDLTLKRRPGARSYWVDIEPSRSRANSFRDPF